MGLPIVLVKPSGSSSPASEWQTPYSLKSGSINRPYIQSVFGVRIGNWWKNATVLQVSSVNF